MKAALAGSPSISGLFALEIQDQLCSILLDLVGGTINSPVG
jgi:hypothetical protein